MARTLIVQGEQIGKGAVPATRVARSATGLGGGGGGAAVATSGGVRLAATEVVRTWARGVGGLMVDDGEAFAEA